MAVTDELRAKIIEIVREKYDPIPSDWYAKDAHSWDDGTGDIADAILALSPPVSNTDIDRTSEPKGHWQDGGKVWVEDHDCSLPVSNTGENAELIERLEGLSSDMPGSVTSDALSEAATALAAADARIVELAAWTTKSEAIIVNYCSQLAAAKMRAETAETLLEEAWRALTPSAETKSAYMGEFRMTRTYTDEYGDEQSVNFDVPWTTIKEIMEAIRARATLDRIGK